MELPDYLPLSMLNQIVFCRRRFWLMYIENEMEINAPVLEGQLRHVNAHTQGTQKDEQGRITRSVQVWSEQFRINGVADFVEDKGGILVPVEHKRGRMGEWINDHVQLCAQAMCLEERTSRSVPSGEIFYWSNRRRERVEFNDVLRTRTIDTIELAFDLIAKGEIPDPVDNYAKCRDCSVESICLPRETLRMLKEK